MKYRVRCQTTISLDNSPGNLALACERLSGKNIPIDAISIADGDDHSLVRLLTQNPEQSHTILEAAGLEVREADVFEVEILSVPDALNRITSALSVAGVNIDYAYGSGWETNSPGTLILKVSSNQKSRMVLDRLN